MPRGIQRSFDDLEIVYGDPFSEAQASQKFHEYGMKTEIPEPQHNFQLQVDALPAKCCVAVYSKFS